MPRQFEKQTVVQLTDDENIDNDDENDNRQFMIKQAHESQMSQKERFK